MRRKISIILHLVLTVVILWAWLSMIFRWSDNGRFSSAGLMTLRYFTVLSNLMQAAASACYGIALWRGRTPHWVCILRYCALVSVLLTFLVVLVFLGPVYGYPGMYRGSSLWMHLIVPLAALADYLFLSHDPRVSLKETLLPLVFPAVYAVFYTCNVVINGTRQGNVSNDFYGFFAAGYLPAAIGVVVIALTLWGISLLLRKTQTAKSA